MPIPYILTSWHTINLQVVFLFQSLIIGCAVHHQFKIGSFYLGGVSGGEGIDEIRLAMGG